MLHPALRLPLALSLGALLLVMGCERNTVAPTPGDHEPRQSLMQEDLGETFAREGDFLVSPVLDAPLLATRVGVMLDLSAPGVEMPALEARTVGADGETGPWLPLELTWLDVEGVAAVLRVDLNEVASAAQLRLPAVDLERLSWLYWSAFVPSDEAERALSGADRDPLDPRDPRELVSDDPAIEVHSPALSEAALLAGVRPRSEWGARAPRCTPSNPTKTRISIHHTVTPRTSNGSYTARIRQIQSYHIDSRGWCDIGYHVMVTADGNLWEATPENRLGTHVGNHNTNNLGVSLVGCFHTSGCANMGGTTPPNAMINATSNIVRTAANRFGISISSSTVMGHRDNPGQSTSCPGQNVHSKLGAIRSAALGGGGGGGTPTGKGRAIGTVWDLSITTDAAQSAALNARLPGAKVRASNGQEVTVPSGDAIWTLSLNPGTYTLTVSKDGYKTATKQVTITSGADSWASVGLEPSATTGRARGTVWDLSKTTDVSQSADLGARLSGAKVRASNGAEVTVPSGDAIWTLELPPGNHTLTASKDGYESATKQVTITAGADSWASIGLLPEATTATVTALVYDSAEGTSAPISGATVTWGTSDHALTDAQGKATFTAAAGSTTLRVVADGFEPLERTLTLTAGAEVTESLALVALPDDQEPEEPVAATAELVVVVFDASIGLDAALSDAVVVVDEEQALTNADGRATLHVPAGSQKLVVVAEGYEALERDLTLVAGTSLLEEVGLIPLPEVEDADPVDLGETPERVNLGGTQAPGPQLSQGCSSTTLAGTPPVGVLALALLFALRARRRSAR